MKEIHLLGVSLDYVNIIFDIIREINKPTLFKLYPNIKKIIEPFMPINQVKYKIMKLGEAPSAPSKVFFATPGPKPKEAIFKSFYKKHGIGKDRYDNIIHSSAYLASSSNFEKGILIEPNVVVSSQSTIGFGVFIKRGSLIGHHNTIGAYTDINPGAILSGNVKIGKQCTIGSGAVIKNDISIGNNTIIGIGSVVTKDLPPNCIAFGNPCKVIRANE